jgi:hypothetical protein
MHGARRYTSLVGIEIKAMENVYPQTTRIHSTDTPIEVPYSGTLTHLGSGGSRATATEL